MRKPPAVLEDALRDVLLFLVFRPKDEVATVRDSVDRLFRAEPYELPRLRRVLVAVTRELEAKLIPSVPFPKGSPADRAIGKMTATLQRLRGYSLALVLDEAIAVADAIAPTPATPPPAVYNAPWPWRDSDNEPGRLDGPSPATINFPMFADPLQFRFDGITFDALNPPSPTRAPKPAPPIVRLDRARGYFDE